MGVIVDAEEARSDLTHALFAVSGAEEGVSRYVVGLSKTILILVDLVSDLILAGGFEEGR